MDAVSVGKDDKVLEMVPDIVNVISATELYT